MKDLYNVLKRVTDIILALILIFLTWWIMIIAAVIIKVSSPGPIIYKANRVGLNGEEFLLYKFRSMRIDSGDIKVTTLSNDDRIFAFGKFMRRTKIDELPQAFNILIGNMSIVGPRPEDLSVAEKYHIGKYKKIYQVRPGLTSPASLFDYTHGELYSTQEKYINEFLPVKLEMEISYIENRSYVYDIEIILRTICVIIIKIFCKKNFKPPREYKKVKLRLIKENASIKDIYRA